MNKGHLSNYFESVVAKRLSAVETNKFRSNQHEFDGVTGFRRLFGDERKTFATKFIHFSSDNETTTDSGSMTWYDAREKHPTRTEYRLYYPSLSIFEKVSENDFLIICKVDDENLFVIITEGNSTKENQLKWLFDLDQEITGVEFKSIEYNENTRLSFIGNVILEELGIDVTNAVVQNDYLDELLRIFPDGFPSTKEFSKYARSTSDALATDSNLDSVILAWMEQEEILFRTYEKHLVEDKIQKGFDDVDSFTSHALSILNRRKSRAGFAFENHLFEIFEVNKISFSHNEKTELKSKPDFLFPGIIEYQDVTFPDNDLYMLAVKTSCKDRWRQVLAEAKKIKTKHLITLEPSISVDQTNEMQEKSVQLVIPEKIHPTYAPSQKSYIMTFNSFMELVSD